MDQKFEGTPKAELSIDGRKVTRSAVTNDWGSLLRWQVFRDGKEVATPSARMEETLNFQDKTSGKYEVVLQMFKYVNYKKDKDGKYTESKFIDISNKVSYTV